MWFSFGVFKGPLTSERYLCNTKYPNSTVQVFWGRLINRAGPLFRRFLAVLNKLTIKSKCLSIMIARVRPARTWILTNNALLFGACTTHAIAQRNEPYREKSSQEFRFTLLSSSSNPHCYTEVGFSVCEAPAYNQFSSGSALAVLPY